jgi:hypothetical protein
VVGVVGVVGTCFVGVVVGVVVGGAVEVGVFPRDVVVVELCDELGTIANDGRVGATER